METPEKRLVSWVAVQRSEYWASSNRKKGAIFTSPRFFKFRERQISIVKSGIDPRQEQAIDGLCASRFVHALRESPRLVQVPSRKRERGPFDQN